METFRAIVRVLAVDTDLHVRRLDVVDDGSAYYSPDTQDAHFGARRGTLFADLTATSRDAHLPWVGHAIASARRAGPYVVALLLTPAKEAQTLAVIQGRNAAATSPWRVHTHTMLKVDYTTLYSSARRKCGDKHAMLLLVGNALGIEAARRRLHDHRHAGTALTAIMMLPRSKGVRYMSGRAAYN